MEYSKPTDVMFDEIRIKQLKDISEKPVVVRDFFSQSEVDYIKSQKDNGVDVKKLGDVNNWKYDKNKEFLYWLEDKFKNNLKHDFVMHGGNYFQTNIPFFVHTDTGKEEVSNLLPYKNIVVPLTQSTKDHPCYTVIFKQRWYGQASMFWKGPMFKKAKTDYNHKIEDYSHLERYTGDNISINEYTRFLTHLPYNNLHGLSIESVHEWNVGDIIVFDCTQLHSSNDFTVSDNTTPKFALSYFCRLKDE